jgi:hypothetical protein
MAQPRPLTGLHPQPLQHLLHDAHLRAHRPVNALFSAKATCQGAWQDTISNALVTKTDWLMRKTPHLFCFVLLPVLLSEGSNRLIKRINCQNTSKQAQQPLNPPRGQTKLG